MTNQATTGANRRPCRDRNDFPGKTPIDLEWPGSGHEYPRVCPSCWEADLEGDELFCLTCVEVAEEDAATCGPDGPTEENARILDEVRFGEVKRG